MVPPNRPVDLPKSANVRPVLRELIIFHHQTCFSGLFVEVIPNGTSIFINRCTSYIHINCHQDFRNNH